MTPAAELPREILERRAKVLAAPLEEAVLQAGLLQLVTFSLGGGRYGVEDGHVRGVARLGRLAPVPGASAAIAGLTMYIGDLLTVVDLRVLLGIIPSAPGECEFLLVLADGRGQLGIMVEGFSDMATVGAGEVKPLSSSTNGAGTDLIRGVALDGVIVINTAGLLAHPDTGARKPSGISERSN